MNHKVLWKIEELWNKYYTYSELINNMVFSCKEKNPSCSEFHVSNNDLILNMKKLYKENISVYNSDFHFVSKFDFTQSKKPIHFDNYGEYLGLENSQVLEKKGKVIYLFDNHNKILQSFLEYADIAEMGFDVVHIDAHDDNALFSGQKQKLLKLENITDYIKQTRISDFFNFMSESNTVKNIYRYTKSHDFKAFKKPKNPYVLSFDIDIFGPEGDFIDLESKVKIITEAWYHADMVCIAMSPGFIDQRFAKEIIKIFV